ncbi:GGDEF domain-containing protein [Clostridium tyrobutyricum]|uniref:GGDEF domain-containing protein n=1 Tax=Clostridium tyrobutyricum TaxID=1519 RepID=UPI001FA70D08|nr:GGDEF domain-containing protein [Clostridium tyrobutyricum]
MILRRVLDMMNKNLYKVDRLKKIKEVQNIFYERNNDCSAVYNNERLVGVLTLRDLVIANPNSVVEDVMTDRYKCIDYKEYIWKIKEIFDSLEGIDFIFAKDENDIVGYVLRTSIDIELGKHIDLLTGLYKNEYLFYNAHKLIKRRTSISLIFIDVNQFGDINKKYGHVIGDLILKNIADILRKNITADMFMCRYAGDEFAILTSYNRNDCKLFSEKLISDIREYEFPQDIPTSISIGIADYDSKSSFNEDVMDMIKKLMNTASIASTKAKESSSNLVIV